MDERFDVNTKIYPTEFVNNSDLPWRIEEDGDLLFIVQPGKISRLESWKPSTNWSRWSKVVRGKDGRLTLTENPHWQCPWTEKFYLLELENRAGAPEENIQVLPPTPIPVSANGHVTVLRDVPRIIPLNVMDKLCKYKKIVWKMAPVKVRIEGTSYFRTVESLVKECVPRDKGDLKNILRERQKIEVERMKEAQDKAEAEREAAMKRIEQDLLA